MSYGIYFEIDTGAEEPACVGDSLNHTYNCSPMFQLALGEDGINGLDGRLAGECIDQLKRAVEHISAPIQAARYQAMNPPNGWGSHDSAKRFLENILAACVAHPKTTIRVC